MEMRIVPKRSRVDNDGYAVPSDIVKRRKIVYSSDTEHPALEQQTPASIHGHGDYTIAWICALSIETAAADAMLDEVHGGLYRPENDSNSYILGRIGPHNIVIASLPEYGTKNAAVVASNVARTFPSIRTYLMVGVGGGVPGSVDLRLGDVVVGTTVKQYNLGKLMGNGQVQRTALPNKPRPELLSAVKNLSAFHDSRSPSEMMSLIRDMLERKPSMKDYGYPDSAEDRLFHPSSDHTSGDECCNCDLSMLVNRIVRTDKEPKIHHGSIGSGDKVIKDGTIRDNLAKELGVICFEMEAAGLVDHWPCLVIRGICDYADSHKNKKWQKFAAASAAAYAKELLSKSIPGIVEQISKIRTVSTSDADERQARRLQFLESLIFEQINSRLASIKPAQVETCHWLLKDPIYQTWQKEEGLTRHHGFLWISGKPGAGKSTMMKFISRRPKTGTKCSSDAAIATFFFHARGDILEKSAEGMYRSLLSQLLENFPDLQQVLDESELVSSCGHNSFEINELQHLLEMAVLLLGDRHFTCYVDALDECEDDEVLEMVRCLEELGCQASDRNIGLRICFSSRHYPDIKIRRGLRLTLEDQPGHGEDLGIYVRRHFQADDSPSSAEIQQQILHKADGVFMWVVLVVDILNEEFRRGRTPAVQKRLHDLPKQLSALFKDILQRDTMYRGELLLCIQWILFAKRPMEKEEFYHAMWSNSAESISCLAVTQVTDDTMVRYVTSCSKGLAEVTSAKNPTV